MLNLCNKAKEILIEEANVQRVDTPVTVSLVPLAGRAYFIFVALR